MENMKIIWTKNSNSLPVRVTIPQPFNLTESKKKGELESEPYHSMAEHVERYSKKTPERFRRPKAGYSPPRNTKDCRPRSTIPISPAFETKTRQRKTYVLSHLQLEELQIEEMKKYHFKATAINDTIMHGPCGIPIAEKKECTKFEPFDFESENRKEYLQKLKAEQNENNQENAYEFHARPVPKALFEGVSGVQQVKSAAPTVPESPQFASKNRKRPMKATSLETLPEESIPKRTQLPNTTAHPFKPKYVEHHVTQPQPFSFEDKTKQMVEHKEQLLQETLEKEKKAREFHANPLPDFSEPYRVAKACKATKLEPFCLETDRLGARKIEAFHHKMVEEEIKCQKQASSFKARAADILEKEPFIPQKTERPPTVPFNFELHSDKRAGERSEWDKARLLLEEQRLQEQKELEIIEKEKEELEIKRIREAAVHHAQPIKQFVPVVLRKSEKPLTQPETPRFSSRLKSRTSFLE